MRLKGDGPMTLSESYLAVTAPCSDLVIIEYNIICIRLFIVYHVNIKVKHDCCTFFKHYILNKFRSFYDILMSIGREINLIQSKYSKFY